MPSEKTYFALLPSDLIKQYFLAHFDMKAIITIMPKLENIVPFKKLLFKGDILGLWKALWIRDISQYRIPNDVSYKKYVEVITKYNGLESEVYTSSFKYNSSNWYYLNNELIQYVSTRGYEKLLYKLTLSSEFSNALRYAIMAGYNDIVLNLINQIGEIIPRNSLLRALREAGQSGHMNTIELLLKLASDSAIAEVRSKGLNVGPNYFSRLEHENDNAVLEGAASGGQLDIVKSMLDKGADNYIDAINGAQMHRMEQLYKIDYVGTAEKLDKKTYKQKVEDVNEQSKKIVDLINAYKNKT